MKTRERERARAMRREDGCSIREIAETLAVSRSTVSVWVRDISLTADQEARLAERNPRYNSQRNGAALQAERARAARRRHQEDGRALARRRDVGFAAGCMLYWAEGSRARNAVEFTNSDPAMIAYFASFLRRYFGVTASSFRIACNLFADHVSEQEAVEQFWLDTVGAPRSALRKSTVNTYSKYSRKRRANKLPYGTCKLVVCDTRIAQMIHGAIQELGGFEREEWATM